MAGPYVETGISMSDPNIVAWAVGCEVVRGYINISNPDLGVVTFGSESNAVGEAKSSVSGDAGGVVSLGDGGIATLTFDSNSYISNGEGDDFAVFENGNASYLELAFAEVSSDGIHFFRFDSVSLTPTNVQVGGLGTLDPTHIHNLAGKHPQGYGTGFDLEELKDVNDLLDVNSITHIRLVDVVGFVEPADFNSDGTVDVLDYSIFAAAYGSRIGDADWNRDCDIHRVWRDDVVPPYYEDPDGLIDLSDFQVFLRKWLNGNDYSSDDMYGYQINDPWPTAFWYPYPGEYYGLYSGGFDLDAVGVINGRLRQE
jgi:hypothetical protein